MKKILLTILLLSQLSVAAWAEGFVVRSIQIEGLQRISPATVESYIPIKRGQTLQPGKTGAILRALYQTGFFDHITISKVDGTLIIHVVERPVIGQLKITGNSVIPTDKLTAVMKSLDVSEGYVYNPEILEKIKQSLLNQYYQLGRYNARVDVAVTPMPRNRVLVKITISEGLVAKVKRITIIGNHVFDESTLVDQMDLTTSGVFTFVTQKDRYSEERLDASLEKLRAYYLDHGYLRFEIKSAQGEVTPNRKSVFVTIVVSEGAPYTVKNVRVESSLMFPDVYNKIHIKPGDTFSRQKVIDAEKAITKIYGDQGYMYTTISIHPDIDDSTHQVSIVFNIKPGKRTYIRHLTFSDNDRTNDVVLRRELQQWESAPASTTKLEDSKQRLTLLPYIKDVEMSVKPVPDKPDQVDVNYKVKENSSAQASFKVGYSQIYRTMFGVGLDQKNFFGTGNTLGINLQRSKYQQFYGVDYTNPYYTEDGISRSFNFAISKVDPSGAGINTGYTTHEYDLGVLYGIPVGQEHNVINRVQAGLGYQNTLIEIVPSSLSNQLNTYITQHGTHYQFADLKVGYSRDSRDKAIFATRGMLHTLFLDAYAPLSSGSVSFFTANYNGKWYQPITDEYIVLTKAGLGYGSAFNGVSNYPFFRNFYAGGIDSVRGYQGLTLGPRDSLGNPFGGNALVDASVGLIFPNYISDSLRTNVFVDAGNVYSTRNNRNFGGLSTNSGPIRYSVGLDADWLTPFGPVELSLAKSFRQPHDYGEAFQFSLGANF